MPSPGPHNDLTDLPGLLVGSYAEPEFACGVTVVLAPDNATAGVDVRGSAPGTRETDLLQPSNLVQEVQAVVLSGGSVYGQASMDGVVDWLKEQGRGFVLDDQGHVAPIVPGAVLFDLGRGKEFVPPISPDWGRRACEAAGDGPVELGCVGAGAGAVAGGVKGGLGSASLALDSGLTVAALVAVNSLGSMLDPDTGLFWELGRALPGDLGPEAQIPRLLPPWPPEPAKNTTIAVVATDGVLDKAQCQKVAQMAHDGLGRAIRPAHTMFDGDTVFCLATSQKELPEAPGFFGPPAALAISEIGAAAADCLSRAIMRGVAFAESSAGFPCLADLEAR